MAAALQTSSAAGILLLVLDHVAVRHSTSNAAGTTTRRLSNETSRPSRSCRGTTGGSRWIARSAQPRSDDSERSRVRAGRGCPPGSAVFRRVCESDRSMSTVGCVPSHPGTHPTDRDSAPAADD